MFTEIHLPQPVTFHVSHVTCLMSRVTCHMSLFLFNFQSIGPLGRCFLLVEMSICLFVCLSVFLCVCLSVCSLLRHRLTVFLLVLVAIVTWAENCSTTLHEKFLHVNLSSTFRKKNLAKAESCSFSSSGWKVLLIRKVDP